MAITIKLNALEMGIASAIAMMRQGVNETHHIKNRKVGKKSDYEIEFTGTRAEVGFARVYNRCPDLTFQPRNGGPDFIINGTSIDTKGSDYVHGDLIAPPHAAGHAMLYVHAVVVFDVITYTGYASNAELFDESNLCVLFDGGPLTHRRARSVLHDMPPIDSLWLELDAIACAPSFI